MPDDEKRKYQLGPDGELELDFPLDGEEKPKRRKPHPGRRATRLMIIVGVLLFGNMLAGIGLMVVSPAQVVVVTEVVVMSPTYVLLPTITLPGGEAGCKWVLSHTDDLIAFVSEGKRSGIYLMAVNHDATCAPLADRRVASPAWSPDGSKIAFQDRGPDGPHIFTMNPDGSEIQQLVNTGKESGYPHWSPDGTQISYVWRNDNLDTYLCVMAADGSNPRCLVSVSYHTPGGRWLPDGKRLVFSGIIDRDYRSNGIHTINVDGSGLTYLIENTTTNELPRWSPDGSKITFYSNRDRLQAIYTMNPDGTEVTRLTPPDSTNMHPVWSPDGRRIAFLSKRTGVFNVWVMDADGANPRNLTHSIIDEHAPSWSPDGNHIVFYRRIDSMNQLFMVNVDGTDEKQLTYWYGLGSTDQVTWKPREQSD